MDFELATLFLFWYIGNIAYNDFNKGAAHAADADKTKFAMIISTAQLVIGCFYAAALWLTGTRKAPKSTTADVIKCIPVGICSAGAHAASVFSLAAGGVAFGQIVKAAEPVFAAVIGTVIYGKTLSTAKWMCLIPIIGGVVIAMLKLVSADKKGAFPPDSFDHPFCTVGGMGCENRIKMDFSFLGLVGACVANLFAAFKGNESHKLMEKKKDDKGVEIADQLANRFGGAQNQFAVMSIISFFVSIPLMVFKEGPVMGEFWNRTIAPGKVPSWIVNYTGVSADTPFLNELALNVILSGVAFYMYNELATLTLKKVSPTTNSVANTAKRVFVIGWGVMKDPSSFSTLKAVGCGICIAGVFVNSNIDSWVGGKKKKA